MELEVGGEERVGMVLNCRELRRFDSDFRAGTTVPLVVEERRAGVEGTPRSAGGLRGIVRVGSAKVGGQRGPTRKRQVQLGAERDKKESVSGDQGVGAGL